MEKKMAFLVWMHCRRCKRDFIDYDEGCPVCMEYLYCETLEEKVIYFSAEPSADKKTGVV
jgi:RNA polymerase subunit RPABC4/transcription elongation factor Spt4